MMKNDHVLQALVWYYQSAKTKVLPKIKLYMLQKRFVHLKVFLNDGQVSRLVKRVTFFQLSFFTNQPLYRFMQIAKSKFANFYILIKTRILLILLSRQRIVILCAIQYHFSNLKNVKNIHRGVLLLVKFEAKACDVPKCNSPPWVFFTFFKLYKWYQIAQSITFYCIQIFLFYGKENACHRFPLFSDQLLFGSAFNV